MSLSLLLSDGNEEEIPPPVESVPEYEFDVLLEHGYVPERCPCHEAPEDSEGISLDELEAEYQEYINSITNEGC